MRDGRTVDERPLTDITKLEIVALMLGKELGEVRQRGRDRVPRAQGRDRCRSVTRGPTCRGGRGCCGRLSHGAARRDRRPGRVARLRPHGAGAGHLRRRSSRGGRNRFDGEPADSAVRPTRSAPGSGSARRTAKPTASFPYMSVRENLTLAALPTSDENGVVDREEQREIVDRFIDRLGIKTSDPEPADPRTLRRQPAKGAAGALALPQSEAADPRRADARHRCRRQGGDPGADRRTGRRGLGVLMISSEIEEITEGSDRVDRPARRPHRGRTRPRRDRARTRSWRAMAHGDPSTRRRGAG